MASHEIFTKQSDGSVSKKIFTAPVGSVIAYPVDSVPDHCLECNGATLTTAAYPELGAVLAESGATSFTLPDLRGEFIRGWDHAKGIDSGRAIGTAQGDEFKSHFHKQIDGYCHFNLPAGESNVFSSPYGYNATNATITPDTAFSTNPTGGTETRPRNVALMYVIVYE